MCGRFSFVATPEEVEELYAVDDIDPFPPRYNIAPTQPILMIQAGLRQEKGSNLPNRVATLVRWGLIPSWVKDVKAFPLLINARCETVLEKNSFKAAIRHRRTLIPASGFYEWKRSGDKKSQAYWVRPHHGGIVTFAGLMETYLSPDGSEIDTGAMLTTSSNPTFMPIHDRMPVVISPPHFERWLNCIDYEPRDMADLFGAVDDDFFEAVPISDKVNKVTNMTADIQARINLNDIAKADETKTPKIVKPAGQLKLF